MQNPDYLFESGFLCKATVAPRIKLCYLERMSTDTSLTPMRESFCQAIASGSNQSDAYRQAFNAENMLPETIWNHASELAKDGKVGARIQELRNLVTDAAMWTRLQAFEASKVNLALAIKLGQVGAANGAVKLAAEFAGIASETPRDIQITKVTVVLNHGKTVEAENWHEVTLETSDEEQPL